MAHDYDLCRATKLMQSLLKWLYHFLPGYLVPQDQVYCIKRSVNKRSFKRHTCRKHMFFWYRVNCILHTAMAAGLLNKPAFSERK